MHSLLPPRHGSGTEKSPFEHWRSERIVRLGREPGRHVAFLQVIAYCGGPGS